MAGKKAERAPWEAMFISVPLSREQIQLALEWDETMAKTERVFINVLEKACKIGLSYNVTTGAFICSVTVPDPVKGTSKRCFSSHAPDVFDSMRLAAYKVFAVLDGDPYAVFGEIASEDMYR